MKSIALILVLFMLAQEGWALPTRHKPRYDKDGYHDVNPSPNWDYINPPGTSYPDWNDIAQQRLDYYLKLGPNLGVAKNVIFFLGDGMGPSTVTAARIFLGQQRKVTGEDALLAWDRSFQYTGVSQTYNTDRQVADSAGTATAFLCGEKARYGTLGVNQKVLRRDCAAVEGNETISILHHSMTEGKWTGIVTTTRVTHATPSAAYAHSPERGWENDSDVKDDLSDPELLDKCKDIAYQMIHGENNDKIRVIFGGGRREFLSENDTDIEHDDEHGQRTDGRDLIQEWLDLKSDLDDDLYKYIVRQQEFDEIDVDEIEYVLGLFEHSHMQYETERVNDTFGEPSLAEMTEKAIQILSRGENGYFLLVEGGRIDHGHHGNKAHRALMDTVALSDAVNKALEMTSDDDTLLVVTADHSHVFSIGGYNTLNNPILGLADNTDGADDKPFLTLHYANGPGFKYHRSLTGDYGNETARRNLTDDDTEDINYVQDAGVPLSSETHGGEDVVVYARGPMSHLFHGTMEQHYIAHAMMYASCVGSNKGHCEGNGENPWCTPESGGQETIMIHLVTIILGLFLHCLVA